MNAKEAAWSALVDHFCKIPPRKRDWEWVVEAKDLTEAYAAAAVAEARAPLVGLLKSIEWQSYRGHLVCPSCNGATIPWLRDGKLQPPGHAADCQLAAALAKETP